MSLSWPVNDCRHEAVRISQSYTGRGREMTNERETSTQTCQQPPPTNDASQINRKSVPVLVKGLTLAVESQAPETNESWSGPTERLMTSPVCPLKVRVCWPVSMSQRPLDKSREGERYREKNT